jgi:hypothetical protein
MMRVLEQFAVEATMAQLYSCIQKFKRYGSLEAGFEHGDQTKFLA